MITLGTTRRNDPNSQSGWTWGPAQSGQQFDSLCQCPDLRCIGGPCPLEKPLHQVPGQRVVPHVFRPAGLRIDQVQEDARIVALLLVAPGYLEREGSFPLQ